MIAIIKNIGILYQFRKIQEEYWGLLRAWNTVYMTCDSGDLTGNSCSWAFLIPSKYFKGWLSTFSVSFYVTDRAEKTNPSKKKTKYQLATIFLS